MDIHRVYKTLGTPAVSITDLLTGESYALLMPLVHSTSISVDEGEKTGKTMIFKPIETWIVYLCHSEGECTRQKVEVPLTGVW